MNENEAEFTELEELFLKALRYVNAGEDREQQNRRYEDMVSSMHYEIYVKFMLFVRDRLCKGHNASNGTPEQLQELRDKGILRKAR